MRHLVAVLVVVSGCHRGAPAAQLETGVARVATSCVRVEGAQLGSLPLELELEGRTVRFAEWTQSDARSAEVVGFAAHLPEDVTFTVEAGERTFTSNQPRWLHPAGVSGPRVHAIDAVTFCTASRAPVLALAE